MRSRLQLIIVLAWLIGHAMGQTLIPKPTFLKHQQKNRIDSIEEAVERKSQFRFQAGHANKVIFAGRNFGVNQSGANFTTSYHHRSGLTVEYEGNYWSGMNNPYALTEIGGYYEKPVLQNFYLTAGYWRLFYHNGDDEERKLFTNFFMLDESWYTPLGQLNATYFFIHGSQSAHRMDINFSKSLDLYHFLRADKFSIEPTVTVTFATANYFSFLSSYTEQIDESQGAFTLGNYEFSLPLIYKKLGKYELNAAWHRAWPVAIPGEEKPNPVSYFTFEVAKMLVFK
jgi:hypothetical protein